MTGNVDFGKQPGSAASWKLPRAWREAAVFGALWGAVEVTVGTFLHATRVPLAGVFLSATGVALLIAGSMILPSRGFPIRTALVCAAIRALSPQGLMPGPMIAIVWQGVLVAVLLVLLRHPLVAGLVAGFIATVSTQVQAFVVKLIFFGADLWELYTRLLERAEHFFGLSPGQGWLAIVIYLLIIGAVGIAGGYLGWRIGSEALRLREEGDRG
ncbi:MAG: hypothetical protein V2A56_08155 [bacterium]